MYYGNGAVCGDRRCREAVSATNVKGCALPLSGLCPAARFRFASSRSRAAPLLPSGLCPAARFRFASSRSRAAPYARRKERRIIRASTMILLSFLLSHGLSLACKFAPVALYEQENYDQGDDKCHVQSYPFREFGAFSCVGLCKEVFPAPSVARRTEQHVYEAA